MHGGQSSGVPTAATPKRAAIDSSPPPQRRALAYGNFRDPLGLAWRMIAGGHGAGRDAVVHEAVQKALAPCDWMLQGFERRLLSQTPGEERPLVLIVGPPRSGTTLVSQVLARVLDVGVTTNLHAAFPRSPLTAARLLRRWERPPVADFHSLYGVTSGWHGLNDAFHVWNRFLGPNRYEPTEPAGEIEEARLRRFFALWTSILGKPLLNKNNRNLACAGALARALPHAYFVCLHRDRLAMAQSLLAARKWIQGDIDAGWGLHAQDAADATDARSAFDAVASQLQRIERTWRRQRTGIDPSRWLDAPYEDFCRDPRRLVDELLSRVPGLERRRGANGNSLPRLAPATRITLPEATVAHLERRFAAWTIEERDSIPIDAPIPARVS